jgi:Protein of unknown function (DUF4038)/Concanavalin A-like lectin/glucanases superfamily/Putative collagen-binding domain of a collagenase
MYWLAARVTRSAKQFTASGIEEFMNCLRTGYAVLAAASAVACQELPSDPGERSSVAQGELVSGLVAAYGFEEGGGTTTADSSGNSLTGSLAGAAWVATGKFGKALSFNGSSSMVSIPDASVLDLTTGMTLSAWIKPTALSGWPCVIMKERAGELTYAMYASSPGGQPNVDYTHNGVEVNLLGSPGPALGTWSYLAATFDGATLRLYVNAAQITSMATVSSIDATTGALRIGGNTVWTEYFNGLIDEVRIYNRALTPAEIQSDMATPVAAAPDSNAPTGTIAINGGAPTTKSTAVNLALSASDANGVAQMRLSSDGTSFTAPEPYATTRAWTLPGGDGAKTVWVQYKDTVGNWSAAISDGIALDTTAPALSGIAASSITATTAGIAWTTSEPATSTVDYGTTTGYGQTATGAASVTSHGVGLAGLAPSTLYHYRVTSVDAAGNSAASGDFTFTTAATSSSPYPLKLAAGKRYIVDQNNQPVFIDGEAAWSLIANLRDEDIELYLADRQQRGVNAILVNLIEHKYGDQAPRDLYGNPPFTTPGDFATRNNAYFDRAVSIVRKAGDHGIVVFLFPAYLGYTGGAEGWYQEMASNGKTKLKAYGQYVGSRFVNVDNLVWVHAGDYNPPDKALTEAVADGIRSVDNRHLHTAHCAEGTSAMDYWSNEIWLDLDNVYTYPSLGSGVPVYQRALAAYARAGWKPFFLMESVYENEWNTSERQIRQQSYEAVLSGGFGYFFGNSPIWRFGAGWQPALDSRGSRDMARIRSLLVGRRWDLLVPDANGSFLIAGRGGSGSDHAVAARAGDGSFGVVYIPTARSNVQVSLAGFTTGTVRARWYDPTSGTLQAVPGSPFAASGNTPLLATPGSNSTGWSDWVLVLDAPSAP